MYGDYGSHEDWNPMEEDYFNEKFNTYEAGPGADLDRSLQPCFRKRSEIQRPLCKLFVHQIPRTLTEEGLRNLFLKFGIPRSVYLCKKPSPYNSYWALVEYSTVSEGQEAINALNGRPPLNLSVQFARSDGEKERLRKETEQEYLFRKISYPHDTYDLPEMESPYPRAIGRGRGVPMLVSAPSKDSYYPYQPYWLSNDELMFRKPIAKGVFNPYHGSVWDPANAHVMDEVSLTVNSSEDGRRISMGRGIPCSESRSRRLLSHKFALSQSEVDHNGLRIGLCVNCSEPSLYSCERCGAWYCSEECQTEDWPMHKEFCMPYLCKKMDSSMTRKEAPVRTEVASEGKAKKKNEGEGKERKGVQREGVHCDGFKRMEGRQLEEARNCQRGGGREEVKNCRKGDGRDEAKNYRRGDGREEVKNCQRGGGREELQNYQQGDGREDLKSCRKGEGREEMKNYRRGEVKNYRRGESREEARNYQRREEEGWKKKNKERKSDGNRVVSLVPDDDDWEKDTSLCSPVKSKIQVEEKKTSSREDSRKISQTAELPHDKFTLGSPEKSNIRVEENKTTSTEDSRKISQTIELPHDKFTMVSVGSVLSSGHYWVQSKDEEKDLISVMKIMNEMGKLSKEPLNLKAGDFCLAMFEGFPYRAKVLSVTNDEAEVFFVDFGNVDTCKFSNIGELPLDAWNYRSQAIEIVMADQTPQEFLSLSENAVVIVKPISEQGNWKIVQVEGVKYEKILSPPKVMVDTKKGTEMDPSTSDKGREQWPKSVLELVKEGMLVVCDVFDVIKGEEDMAILGMAFDDITEDLFTVFRDFPDECSKLVLDPTLKPKVGDLIAGTTGDEKWLRGVVLSEESTGWMVAFCDTGSMSIVKDLRQVPDDPKYREAPAFAIQCRVLKSFLPRKDLYSENRIAISSRLHLKIVACNGEEVVADMLTKERELFCKVKLEPWRPKVTDLSCQVLNNGDKVHIVSYFNTAAIFVQAADDRSQKNIQSLLQEVAGACIDGRGRVQESPTKGTLVACKFSGDGNYYRALVMDVREENEVFVSYVDFGNQEWVPLEKVQRLPDELKKIPCFAVKIGLKVQGILKLTPDAVRLLNTFILNNEELKIVFSNGDLRNCELITKSGVNLNDKIVGLAEPSIKSPSTLSDGRIKWTSEMVGKLEIPKSGSLSIKFLILHFPGKCTVVGCAAEDPRIPLVYKTFPAEVSEYCEKCPQVPYVPVAYELCLAKFTDGLWYRGFAADAKGDESQIYFVDFGNWMKVKHKDIRKMVPEFLKVPFIAVLCTYKGFEEETMTEEQENALKQLLTPNTLFFASISQGHDPDEYILDISQVTQELKSKNLLP